MQLLFISLENKMLFSPTYKTGIVVSYKGSGVYTDIVHNTMYFHDVMLLLRTPSC